MSQRVLKDQVFKRYVDSDLSLVKLHEEFRIKAAMEGKKIPTLTTFKRWSSAERWTDRRDEQRLAKRRRELGRIQDKLRMEGPSAIERISDFTKLLIGRNTRLLLPGSTATDENGMCITCARGPDTDSGLYKPKVNETVQLMRLQLDLHGQMMLMQAGSGGTTAINLAFPGEDTPAFQEFAREAAELFAKHEGAIPETHITPDGEVGDGPDLGGTED